MMGRRLPDIPYRDDPKNPEPGDYWKYTGIDLGTNHPTNLTRTVWGICLPDNSGIDLLMSHTVREETDGTISVRPGDGSSNSILHHDGRGSGWHGYIEHGEWSSVGPVTAESTPTYTPTKDEEKIMGKFDEYGVEDSPPTPNGNCLGTPQGEGDQDA